MITYIKVYIHIFYFSTLNALQKNNLNFRSFYIMYVYFTDNLFSKIELYTTFISMLWNRNQNIINNRIGSQYNQQLNPSFTPISLPIPSKTNKNPVSEILPHNNHH